MRRLISVLLILILMTGSALATESAPRVTVMAPGPALQMIPNGEPYSFTTEVLANGKGRTKASEADKFEVVRYTLTVGRLLAPGYYEDVHSDKCRIQGNEAAVEITFTLDEASGKTAVLPQNTLYIRLFTADGERLRAFQLMDAEILGSSEIELKPGETKTLYKRFQWDDSTEITALSVTCYNDGEAQEILFALGAPLTEKPIVYASLQRGSKGEDVVRLQARLIELGYLIGSADGVYGKQTETAVKAAQKAYGQEENGIADPEFQKRCFSEAE